MAAAFAFLALAGCGRDNPVQSPETEDSTYREGQQLDREGRSDEALNAYLKVIARRGDAAPESHLDAAIIYMVTIKNPIAAIYHFSKFLELEPNAKQAPEVRGMIEACKRQFAQSLPGQPLENQSERMGYLDRIAALQRENDDLKAQIAANRGGTPSLPVTRAPGDGPAVTFAPIGSGAEEPPPVLREAPMGESPVTAAPLPAQPQARPASPAKAEASSGRHHVVVRGDTLSSISMKYYGSRSKVGDIVAANRGVLQDKNTPLKLGATLNIP
jgi:tetratricopeptide (TPR) repeat protein